MLILASASPRRKELLENLGYKFECLVADTDETLEKGIDGYNAVYELAYRKAKTVAAIKPDGVILASDTVVFCDGEILGKPNDRADAENMPFGFVFHRRRRARVCKSRDRHERACARFTRDFWVDI